MPGFTTADSQALLLDYLTGRAVAYAAPRDVYLGLAYSMPADGPIALDSIGEVSTPGYTREIVPWAAPGGDPISIASNADVQFGPVTEDMTTAAQYAFLTEAAGGTAGLLLYVWQLLEPVLALANKPIYVAAGALTIQ